MVRIVVMMTGCCGSFRGGDDVDKGGVGGDVMVWVAVVKWMGGNEASKKQTCVTNSTMVSEFVALAATGKEAECQMYNGKSRKLGVRHSMIRELIMNGVVSIEFVRSQQKLANHLTKGLARDLVIKSVEGMGLKSNLVTEC
ncbi:hypothetical protein Tco_1506919 [Tanacetum coccineum]